MRSGKTTFCAAAALFAALFLFVAACAAPEKNPQAAGENLPEKRVENSSGPSFGPAAPGPKPGQKAPSFQLPELDSGRTAAFPENFSGKKVALVFFSAG